MTRRMPSRTRIAGSASWSTPWCTTAAGPLGGPNGQLKQVAETFFKTHDHTCSLFAFVYEDVVHDMGLPTFGMGAK